MSEYPGDGLLSAESLAKLRAGAHDTAGIEMDHSKARRLVTSASVQDAPRFSTVGERANSLSTLLPPTCPTHHARYEEARAPDGQEGYTGQAA